MNRFGGICQEYCIQKKAEVLRNLEAQIGRIYWECYFAGLERYEAADKWSRRPATDPLNALINYGYGMLYGEVESAALTAGLDPHIGILHREEHGKPAFVFDAIEPFRPWVDRLVAELAIGGKIKSSWFEIGARAQGLGASVDGENSTPGPKLAPSPMPLVPHWLSKEGKKAYIPAWYAMMLEPTLFNGKKIKRKDQIQYRLTTLAQYLLKAFGVQPEA